MKTKFAFCALLALTVTAFAEEPAKSPEAAAIPAAATNMPPRWPAFKSEREKVSYAMGFDMAGFHLAHRDIIDKERMVQGFRDAFDAYKPMMDYAEAKELMERFEKEVQQLEKKQAELEGVKNRRLGAAFLEENKKKEGVKPLPSGLQYKVVKEGKGTKPTLDNRVRIHYTVKNIDGNVLDESRHLSKPVGASMRSLMKGWQEGLQLMQEGAVYEFYIPSELAYGDQGAGRTIKPNDTLVTEVELIAIEK